MFKKKLRLSVIFISIFFSYIVFEMLSINSKTINRDLISLEINNIRNPQIKKMMRVVDDFYAQFLYNVSKKNKSYFINEDNRDELPETKVIKKTNVFSENLYPLKNNGKDWYRNYGGHSSNRFSELKLINKQNLDKLNLAWEFKIDGGANYDIQSNALVVDSKIFIPTSNKKIIALDAISGNLFGNFC